ncbi:MAG: lipid-binding SYLF domain-containing protein [Gammaproteobacteria bacterium]|nr:lipid-binding SYLF domain-containing protein [Gammaproteobacteria bacterium]
MHLSALRLPMFFLITLAAAAGACAQAREEARLLVASQVLEELRSQRDQMIPDRLLERAYGIVVVPEVIKAGLIVGGRAGRGVLVVRDEQGHFSNPVFVRLAGGSFGWQAGVQETDVVLVFTTRRGVEGITDGKLTLGADASVAAGPVGRQASAATDASFSAEVYSYSRNRGLFAGVALDGSALTIDRKANASFYGKPQVVASDIIAGTVTSHSEMTQRFLKAVATSTSPEVRPGAESPASAPAAVSAPPAESTEAPSKTRSFPMEDPHPGSEPKR